ARHRHPGVHRPVQHATQRRTGMSAQARDSAPLARRRSPGPLWANVFMLVCLGYFLAPLVWLLISSTKTNAGLFSSFGFWFDKNINIGKNLADLFAYDNGHFVLWMRNTAFYSVVVAVGSSLISTLAGYAFARYQFAGRNFLFGIVLASVFVPSTVFAVPL